MFGAKYHGFSGVRGYRLTRSLRFRASASAYLNRTFGTPTLNTKWTVSVWCKKSGIAVGQNILGTSGSGEGVQLQFSSGDVLAVNTDTGGVSYQATSNALYRDPSSWYNIIIAVDTTQATAANRLTVYVNGTAITWSSFAVCPQNTNTAWNKSGIIGYIGSYDNTPVRPFNGYMAEIISVDGQTLTSSSFGQSDPATGVWVPKKYSGTYGNNGFYLPFTDTSSTTNLCKDNALLVSSNLRSSGTNIGGMTANGGLAGAFDGVVNAAAASAVSPSAVSGYVTTNAVGKDWGAGVTKTIVAFTANSPTDAAFRGDAVAVGFKLQGSTDNFSSSVVDLYSGTTPAGTAASLSVSSGIDTSTAYRYHRFVINGNGTNNTFVGELGLYESGTNGWNNWTPNNISLTAGVTYDSMIDVPYCTGQTGGTQPSGNYATLNPVTYNVASQYPIWANLRFNPTVTNNYLIAHSTISVSSGLWYAECTPSNFGSSDNLDMGVCPANVVDPTGTSGNYAVAYAGGYSYTSLGRAVHNTTTSATYSTLAANDVLQIALDLTNGKLYFGKNGTWQNSGNPATGTNPIFTGLSGSFNFASGITTAVATVTVSCDWNFGQRPFSYTPPSGYSALCAPNLAAPTIKNGAGYMAATTYTGTGASQSVTNTVGSTSFKPDLVWIKSRSAATNHDLFDSVRGTTKYINSNTQTAQTTDANTLTAFASNGFTLGSDASSAGVNVNAATYVGWQWLGSNTTVSNTSGTITSTVCVNTTSGISIITYTGNGTLGATIGHGLGVAPDMVINKQIASIAGSTVYHKYANASPATGGLFLESTSAFTTNSGYWNNTAPTSTLITLGQAGVMNNSGVAAVVYAFATIAGFSAFGSYTGNGSTDGPFVYCGFRPKFVLLKISSTTGDWVIYDTTRDSYNPSGLYLYPDTSAAEGGSGTPRLDFVSNGFKLRQSGQDNTSSATYIYAAFAENPFNYANAR